MWPDVAEQVAIERANIPSGHASHSQLLAMMVNPTTYRSAVISDDLQIRLSTYLSYRHVFRHAYSFQLDWAKMRDLVLQSEETWRQLQNQLDQFFN